MTNSIKPSAANENERYTAALSYVWILCLYTLLFKRDSSFIQFHAKQGLAVFVFETAGIILLPIYWLIVIVCVLLSIWGIKSALEGKYWTMPLIGEWIKKTKV